MKYAASSLTLLLLFGVLSAPSLAQERPKADDKPKAEVQSTPVKVQIVFTDFEGDKKVKSLPYILYVNASDAPEPRPGWSKLRVGNRVPIYTGGREGSMSYIDVGTNIDSRVSRTGEGRFLVQLNLERSWVEGDVPFPVQKSATETAEQHTDQFHEPVIRQFRSELELKLREGQLVESTMATDPLSGKVLKVEVSLSVVK